MLTKGYRIVLDAFIILLLISTLLVCRSAGTGKDSDSSELARAKAELAEQRETINRMGGAIEQVQIALSEAERYTDEASRGADDLEEWFKELDDFVRRLIRTKQELDAIQPATSGANAGEGSGVSELLRRDYRERERNTKPPAIIVENTDRPRRTNPTGGWGNNFQGGL